MERSCVFKCQDQQPAPKYSSVQQLPTIISHLPPYPGAQTGIFTLPFSSIFPLNNVVFFPTLRDSISLARELRIFERRYGVILKEARVELATPLNGPVSESSARGVKPLHWCKARYICRTNEIVCFLPKDHYPCRAVRLGPAKQTQNKVSNTKSPLTETDAEAQTDSVRLALPDHTRLFYAALSHGLCFPARCFSSF